MNLLSGWRGQAFVVVLGLLLPAGSLFGYTPDSPEVVEMLQRAMQVLAKEDHGEPGGKALIALAMLKGGAEPTHPRIQQAAAAVRSYVATIPRNGLGRHCYNAAICCLFLIELDHAQYKPEIEVLLAGITGRQQSNGCWSYDPKSYDDTSQSQYGVLAMWAAHVHGLPVEASQVAAAMNWFLRTQDLSGGWSYRAKDPGSMQRISQEEPPTQSMSAAGAGSIYICAYLMGFGRRSEKVPATGRPSALRVVNREEDKTVFLSSAGVDQDSFRAAAGRGNAWFATRTTFAMDQWTHYYMYGLERYKAFQALVESKPESEPKWYNDGVEFLRKTQEKEGGWASLHVEATRPISTAFAVMFLTRSTEKSIKKLEGLLRGGLGLPPDLTQVNVDSEGRVVDTKEIPPIDVLLSQLDKEGVTELDTSVPKRLQLAQDPTQRSAQLARLRRMATRGPYEVRRMAVNTLARDRNLDNVPALIFALSDPDAEVARAAQAGLRFISRRIDGVPLPENPSKADWQAAQAKWREWYLSLRPDAVLLE